MTVLMHITPLGRESKALEGFRRGVPTTPRFLFVLASGPSHELFVYVTYI